MPKCDFCQDTARIKIRKKIAWSKTKSTLCKLKAGIEEALGAVVGAVFDFTFDDLTGWFMHCGCQVNN